jgi:hypothetical protein
MLTKDNKVQLDELKKILTTFDEIKKEDEED